MVKRTVSFVMVMIMVLSLCCNTITATADTLMLPASLKEINEQSFYGDRSLERIVVPEGTESIDSRAFANSSVSVIILPKSLNYIAEDTFDNVEDVTYFVTAGSYAANWLIAHGKAAASIIASGDCREYLGWSLTLDGTLTIAGIGAMDDYDSYYAAPWLEYFDYVNKIVIENGITSIGSYAFAYCTNLNCNLVIPSSVTKIGDCAFEGCEGLYGNLKLPSKLESIGDYAFLNCSGLSGDLVIPNSVTSIGIQAFDGCNGFDGNLVIGEGVTNIPYRLFSGCTGFGGELILGSNVHYIGKYAFDDCWGLKGMLNISASTIDEGAFNTCYGFTGISFNEKVQQIGDNAFSEMTGLLQINCYRNTYAANWAISNGFESITKYYDEAELSEIELISPALSCTEENPAEIQGRDLEIVWNNIGENVNYHLYLQKLVNGEWVQQSTIVTKNAAFCFEDTAFSGITQKTLYRLGISYEVTTGETAVCWYYMNISPVVADKQIYVEDATSFTWDQSALMEGYRVFSVKSETPWNATTTDDWLKLTAQDGILGIRMNENMTGASRTATVCLKNQDTEATITVRQGSGNEGPTISSPKWSNDRSTPTTVSTGRVYIDQKDEKKANKVLYRLTNLSTNTVSYTTADEFDLAVGTYQIRICGIYSIDGYQTNEVFDDMLYTNYYLNVVNANHSITVNGTNNITVRINDDLTTDRLHVVATNGFTASSDSDWLKLDNYNGSDLFELASSHRVYAEPNLTSTTRTGTVTLHCGSASAKITVIQESNLIRVVYPSGLSTSQINPTILNNTAVSITAYGKSLRIEKYTNGVWEELSGKGRSSTSYTWLKYTMTSANDDFLPNVLYRIKLTAGTQTQYYYFKASSSSNEYIYVNKSGWDAPAGADSLSVSVSSSGKWTASSSASWLTLSSTSGSNGASVTLKAAANTTGADRTAVVTFKRSTYASDCIYVIQRKAYTEYLDVYFTGSNLSDGNTTCQTSGSAKSLGVKTNNSGTAQYSTTDSWITISKASTDSTVTSNTIKIAANTSGAKRVGSVTVKQGSLTKTLKIIQDVILNDPITSPAFSTDGSTPSTFVYGDLNLSWEPVNGAKRYRIRFYEKGTSQRGWAMYLDATETSCTIESSRMKVGGTYGVQVYALDSNDFAYGYVQWFTVVDCAAIVINNQVQQYEWQNADDYGASSEFSIATGGSSWTAKTNDYWIQLVNTTGDNGQKLSVKLDNNDGYMPRTGIITITAGTLIGTIIVNQLACSDQYPTLITPELSKNSVQPTIVPVNTNSLTFTWNNTSSGDKYKLSISIYKGSDIQTSPVLYRGESSYTFNNITLEPGVMYVIDLVRINSRWGSTERRYYIVTDDGSNSVLIDKKTSDDLGMEGAEDTDWYDIEATGGWTASSDCDWLMVSGQCISTEQLAVNGESAADYKDYYSKESSRLYICALENMTGGVRNGVITVSCGSAKAYIYVTQSACNAKAAITNIALATTSSGSTKLPYGPLKISWSKGEGGNGRYLVEVKKNSTVVYRKTTTLREMTIPESSLLEGTDYVLYLYTAEDDLGQSEWKKNRYFFTTGYENELSVTLSVDWSMISETHTVYIRAQALGGTGTGYKYHYKLYRNGQIIQESMYEPMNYYTFPVEDSGTYLVGVYVKDSAMNTANSTSETKCLTADDTTVLELDHISEEVASGSTVFDLSYRANGKVTVTSQADWIYISGKTENQVTIGVKQNTSNKIRTANVLFTLNSKSVSFTIVQEKQSNSDKITLSEEKWMLTDSASAIREFQVIAGSNWNVIDAPAWIHCSTLTDGSGFICLCDENNTTNSRSGEIRVESGTQYAVIVVLQPGKTAETEVNTPANYAIRFEANKYTASIGEEIVYTINHSADVTELWFVVDDVAYDQFAATGTKTSFTRSFSMKGERKVTFMQKVNGVWITGSNEHIMNITAIDTLQRPSITGNISTTIAQDYTFSIGDVDHAELYKVSMCTPDLVACYYQEYTAEQLKKIQNKICVPGELITQIAEYKIYVLVSGNDYSQNQASMTVSVRAPYYTFECTTQSEKIGVGDELKIAYSKNGNVYVKVQLIDPNGKPEAFEPASGLSNSSNAQMTFVPSSTGAYKVRASVYLKNVPVEENILLQVKELNVYVTGIEIISAGLKQGWNWIDDTDDPIIYVKTNVYANQAVAFENGVMTSNTMVNEYTTDGNRYVFAVPASKGTLTLGKHTLVVEASNSEYNTGSIIKKTVVFYYVESIPEGTKNVYPLNSNVCIYTSPITKVRNAQMEAQIVTGSYPEPLIVTGDAGDYFRVRTIHDANTYGFIVKTDVSTNIPASASGKINIISPNEGAKIASSTDKLNIEWQSGISLPAAPSVQYTLKGLTNSTSITKRSTAYGVYDFDISSLIDGDYLLTVTVAGQQPVSVHFVKGAISTEEQYREWFSWMTLSRALSEPANLQNMEKLFALLQAGYLRRDCWADFVTLGMKEYKDGLHHDGLYNGTDKGVQLECAQMRVIASTVTANKSAILDPVLSNVRPVSQQKVANNRTETIVKTIFDGFEAVTAGTKVVIDTFTLNGSIPETQRKAIKKVIGWIDDIESMAKTVATNLTKQYNTEVLVIAYIDEYKSLLMSACDAYVEYLQKNFINGASAGETTRRVAKQYIDAFKNYKAQLAAMPSGQDYLKDPQKYANNSALLDAVNSLINATGIKVNLTTLQGQTVDFVKVIQNSLPDILYEVLDMLVDKLIDFIKEKFQKEIEDELKTLNLIKVTKDEIIDLFKDFFKELLKFGPGDKGEPITIEFCWEEALNKLVEGLEKKGLSNAYAYVFVDEYVYPALCQFDDNSLETVKILAYIKSNKSQKITSVYASQTTTENNIFYLLRDTLQDAWNFGCKLGGLITDAENLAANEELMLLLDEESLFYAAMRGRIDSTQSMPSGSGEINMLAGSFSRTYTASELSKYSIKELELIRAQWITQSNFIWEALVHYENMRSILSRDRPISGHWAFVGKIGNETDYHWDCADFGTSDVIISDIKHIKSFVQRMSNIPENLKTYIETLP